MKSIDRMPILFVGHGSPMNAIEENEYTKGWEQIASQIPRPKGILMISAHWYTKGTKVTDLEHPEMIYDMYGFPPELYQLKYNPSGAPELAGQIKELIERTVEVDHSWGFDHGMWSVLCKMYPKADIPVLQLSVDQTASATEHFQMGKDIASLREQGILIIASGNVVHNLAKTSFSMKGGYPWAYEFDQYVKDNILSRDFQSIIHYENAGDSAQVAFFTPDHFYPLLYILGASNEDDKASIFNESCVLGSLSMTCYLFQC